MRKLTLVNRGGVALALVGLLSACGGSPEAEQAQSVEDLAEAGNEISSMTIRDPQTGDESKVSVRENGDTSSIVVEQADGTRGVMTIGDGAAASLPDWAPLYPGASVETGMAGSSVEGSGGMVTMRSTDSLDKVMDFYRDHIADAGMEITLDMNTPEMRMLSAQKAGTDQALQLMFANEPEGTRITMFAGIGG